MEKDRIKELIRKIKSGGITEKQAEKMLRELPFAELPRANVDHHRSLRQGMGEVVFGEGKAPADLIAIVQELIKHQNQVLVTRVSSEQARLLRSKFKRVSYNPVARTVRVPGRADQGRKKTAGRKKTRARGASVALISAGTSDAPVLEEAKETLLWLGLEPEVLEDVGVAGIHRLFAHRELLDRAAVIIVVAGMEGALASVVGGLVDKPVIAVPTSVGYGAGAGGLAALLGMLNSCAQGVLVTNIDNGFGAACAAARILSLLEKEP